MIRKIINLYNRSVSKNYQIHSWVISRLGGAGGQIDLGFVTRKKALKLAANIDTVYSIDDHCFVIIVGKLTDVPTIGESK